MVCQLPGHLVLLGGLLVNAATAEVQKQTYTYKRVGTLEIKADVYRQDDQRVRPVIVWIHGGALIMGGRESVDGRIRKMFLDAGYAIVSIDYRLAPETKLPAIIEDLEDAFKWIREKGPELFGIDSSRIALLGGSAGGYLTLATGHRVKPRPTALVSFWGYGDLIGDWYSTPSSHPRHQRSKMSEGDVRKQVSGPPIANSRDRNGDGGAFYQFCRQRGIWPQEVSGWDPHKEAKKFEPYMPLNNVTPEYPPTLLIHGTKDTDVPYEQSVMMAEQFKKHGIDHELVTIEGAEHGLAGGDPQRIASAYERAFEFVHSRMTADSLPRAARLREPLPDPNRGLYAIWAKPEAIELPFIKGGQVVVQWRDLQLGQDKYDFSQLDAKLEAMHKAGRVATVQVNGNQHPTFLFEIVPCHPERLSIQVADKQGTLQYWHPAYVKAYCDFLAAYAEHLKQSPFRSAILGVRLNFNAVGTEHTSLTEADRDPRRWICPPGVSPGPIWTPKTASDYKRLIVDTFVKHFSPEIRVFVRNNVFRDFGQDREFESMFETGRLALFHTSTEVEPRSRGVEAQYLAFLRFCRPGNTLAYAECWADAWGRHGGITDPRWCSPCQWNYWRLLADLHCGVSFVAIYGGDLAHADDPQFRAAFEFAQKYAGYHASPSVSPGAWIALREGDFLKGDYTFLMERLPGDTTDPKKNVGLDDQRFGAWARTIPAGGRLRFSLDERFARSLGGRKAIVRVTYLDSEKGSFNVVIPGQTWAAQMAGSGRWTTDQLLVPSASFEGSNTKPDIEIQAQIPVSFHMVEVTRAD